MLYLKLARVAACVLLVLGLATTEARDTAWANELFQDPVNAPAGPADEPKSDMYGDPLPQGVRLRLGRSLTRRSAGIWSLRFSPNGKTLATTHSKIMHLWDVSTGREIRRFLGHTGVASCLSFSPDGKTLASQGADWTIRLWEIDTGKELRRISGFQFTSVTFAPDGQALATGSFNKVVCLWEAATGKELKRFVGHEKTIRQVIFSPDGKTLASAGDGKTVRLWDVASGKELRQFPQARGMGRALAFSPDGRLLAMGSALVDLATGKELRQLDKCSAAGWSNLVFAPDGRTVLGLGPNQKGVLWEVATGKMLQEFGGHRSVIGSFAFSPDGKLIATGGWDETFHIWDLAAGKELHLFPGCLGEIAHVAFSAEGKTLASRGVQDRTIRLWDRDSGRLRATVDGGFSYHGTRVLLTPDGQIMASAAEAGDRVRRWETATGKELTAIGGERGERFQLISFSPDGTLLASASHDGLVRIRDVMTGRILNVLRRQALAPEDDDEGPFPQLTSLLFSADGRYLAAGGDHEPTCYIWDLTTGKELRRLGYPEKVTRTVRTGWHALAFSADGRTIAGVHHEDNRGGTRQHKTTIELWELSSGKLRLRIANLTSGPKPGWAMSPERWHLTYTADSLCAGAKDGVLRFWDPRSGKELSQVKGHQGAITSLAFVPATGNLLTGSSDTTILVWDRGAVPQARIAPSAPLGPAELEALWLSLASAEADKAYQAIFSLVAVPQLSVPFLEKHVRPVAQVEGDRLGRLIVDLDSNQFATRQKALEELEKLADLAEPALKQALAAKPSLELGQRIERLLQKLGAPITDPKTLQAIRAVEVLEQIGNAEARRALESVAKGAAGAPPTREAQASLSRLATRAPVKP
jgi:WD40 repeat protein